MQTKQMLIALMRSLAALWPPSFVKMDVAKAMAQPLRVGSWREVTK